MFPVHLVDICRFFKAERTEYLKIGLNYTEFCAHQVRGPQNCADLFCSELNPELRNFWY